MQFNRSLITAGLASAAVLGALAAGAGPAFAATGAGPTSSAQATVTVTQSITFAFTSPASFNLAPGVTSHNAIAFNVQTNDNHGYTLSLSAPDPSTGTLSFPAAALSYTTFLGAGNQVGQTDQLSNTAAVFQTTTNAPGPAGDGYTEDWTANLPSNQQPGNYSTTLTYIATAS
jgi:hypothetical protein